MTNECFRENLTRFFLSKYHTSDSFNWKDRYAATPNKITIFVSAVSKCIWNYIAGSHFEVQKKIISKFTQNLCANEITVWELNCRNLKIPISSRYLELKCEIYKGED